MPITPGGNTAAKATPRKVTTPPRTQTEWEARIDQVLDLQAPETETAKMLINLMPTLPPDGQAEAAQHVTNLILDKDYGLVMPMLRNPAYGEAVQDVLITDLMNREDNVKLPALLEVARIPNHPYHEEAMTDLDGRSVSRSGLWHQLGQVGFEHARIPPEASGGGSRAQCS